MLFNLVETLQKRRRLLFVAAFIIFDIWLIAFCNQTLQAHRPNMTGRIQDYEHIQTLPAYQQEALYGDSLNRSLYAIEISALRALMTTTDGITKAEESFRTTSTATATAISNAATSTGNAIGSAAIVSVNTINNTASLTKRIAMLPFVAVGHGAGYAFGGVSKATSSQLASVIQPKKDVAAAPVITPEQAHQATLIQENTVAVTPVKPVGAGGACDNGAGNGGYPMEWCDARMDTVKTVSYSADRINRECTSYAYWYFTTIGGHSDFHVTGNANRWAYTSNYPTHTTPAVGAIAVETGGYYGHVAIVQALAGATYDGKTVPEGYVLVSEMNYDWQGHFRYSYSPLGKFSAYIYP